jgi:hypothetical protein
MKFKTTILLLVLSLIFTSCRKEETQFEQVPEDEVLDTNSNISDLILRTATNDGSLDNIVDKANCFNVAFPYTVSVNGAEITVNSQDDYAVIECVFDQSDSDTDSLNITFPITIILDDFSEVAINSLAELNTYTNNCNGENIADNDIECIDFDYPIEASTFNPNNELLNTLLLESDRQLFDFVSTINEDNIVTIDFPIAVTLSDNSETSINNFVELETAIQTAINTCDEDDDYDYSDDDCNDCTPTAIETILINCNDWQVNRLKRNAMDYDDAYDNYDFNFFADGSMSVFWNTTTVFGTWSASGTGDNLEILIDVPSLPLCNNTWILQEIKNCSNDTEINLTVGNDDRLQYINGCN